MRLARLIIQKTPRQLLRPEVAFVYLALLFGIIYCFVTPPFFVLDESVHFDHAYQVSRGQLRAQKLDATYYGGYVSENIDDSVLQSLTYRSLQPNFRTTYGANFKDRAIAKNPSVKVKSIFNSTAVYSPIAYLPQAAGILLGRLLHLPVVWLLYLGRIANLLVWIALVAAAIKLLPFGKWALFVVALLPTSIFESASLSADALTTGLAFLAAAMVFKLVVEKTKLSDKAYWLLLAVMVLLSLTKPPYYCFVFLVLALPLAKFRDRLDYWKKTLGIIAASLIPALAWDWSVRHIDITLPAWPDHPLISSSLQLHKIIHAPQHFIFGTWSSYLTGRADITINTFIGQFGRVYDLQLPLLIVIAAYLLIFIAFMSDENITSFKHQSRLRKIAAGVLLLTLLSMTTILYLTYSQVGGNYVSGIQARYFLPMMVLLVPIAKLRKAGKLRIQASPVLYLAGSAVILLISVVMMAHRFYSGF